MLLLSTMMPLAPPNSCGEVGPGTPFARDIMQPFLAGTVKHVRETLQKRKSVPILELKKSVTGPHRDAVLVDSCTGPLPGNNFPLESKPKR